MISKTKEKQKAIDLRKEGMSYSEILSCIPVAKSTLSLWLRSVDLSKKQNQVLTEKKRIASLRGGEARRNTRIKITNEIYKSAESDIGRLSKRELWLIGVILYWGEGAKEKAHKPGSSVDFTNSDPYMVRFFVKWLQVICKVKKEDIHYVISIHKIYKDRIDIVKDYWAQVLEIPVAQFEKIQYKQHNPKTIRKNIGNVYNGNLRVRVRASSSLLRKITGWIRGISKNNWGIV